METYRKLGIPADDVFGVQLVRRGDAANAIRRLLKANVPVYGYDAFRITASGRQPDLHYSPDWSASGLPDIEEIEQELADIPEHITHIEFVFDDDSMPTYQGSCHCGRVRFRVTATIDHVRVCDCSICRRRGALNFRVQKGQLELDTPWEDLTLYQWGSKTAKDYFCPTCGILPFRRPSDPTTKELEAGTAEPFDGWAINVRCLEGIDIDALPRKLIYGSRIVHDT